MAGELNDLLAYPEVKTYTLINLYSKDENIVTEQQLKEAFSEENLMMIRSGRSEAWTLIEN